MQTIAAGGNINKEKKTREMKNKQHEDFCFKKNMSRQRNIWWWSHDDSFFNF